MSKWPTIEEMLSNPIDLKAPDPFYHTFQYPKFMRRKVILPDTYEKSKKDHPFKPLSRFHRRTVSEEDRDQVPFIPYGRVQEQIKSIYEKESAHKYHTSYDEAEEHQEVFTKISPEDPDFTGVFRHSSCPRKISSQSSQRTHKPTSSGKSSSKLTHKLTVKFSSDVSTLAKSNVLAILSKNTPKKCTECGLAKCTCPVVDNEIPENMLENIQKGKNLIQKVKEEKREKAKIIVSKPTTRPVSQKESLYDKLMKIVSQTPKKDPNTIEGTPVVLHTKSRRFST